MKDFTRVIEDFGVKNQYVIATDKGVIFQSYNSIIAIIEYGKLKFVGGNYQASKTTGKYRNLFFTNYFSEISDLKSLEKFISEKMVYNQDLQGYVLKEV
ncbi:hypothetical protein [Fusobacterium phage Fnu1]|uniref:DUF8033 domain-containing protein n=1 Tax=Fusobacterium phage Fnu1 TaxID=2530024 RepID=A0A481W7H2_9CAUD|nr:hypothetical protein KMD24_gp046 [Fusobacterium phage Fnu1]QBJ04192.1 hypothetical protein [Fusobacterium phage Fnu1]